MTTENINLYEWIRLQNGLSDMTRIRAVNNNIEMINENNPSYDFLFVLLNLCFPYLLPITAAKESPIPNARQPKMHMIYYSKHSYAFMKFAIL